MNLPKVYEPGVYEPNTYALWEQAGAFAPTGKGEPYSIVMPPPNANGNLHIGHALSFGLEDVMVRYYRMKGRDAVLIPGADHAGFETWVVYEKQLNEQGKSRFDFSREKLYSMVWDYVEERRGDMELQLRALGVGASWEDAEVEKLLPLIHDIAERNRISVHSDDYIRKQAQSLLPDDASLHFIELDGEPISGAFLFEDETTCYYAHAGTAAKHYKLQANTALMGELLAYAKNKGKKRFDLYGIAPTDDENHPWAGVTSFKAGFGGEIVRYNQTYDIPLRRILYAVYSLLRSLTRRRG